MRTTAVFDLFNQPEFMVHARENNHESKAILEAGRKDFSRQCKMAFMQMMSGQRITSRTAFMSGISHLARRIKDLKDIHGVQISDITLEDRYKEWYMTPEQIQFNQKFIRNETIR